MCTPILLNSPNISYMIKSCMSVLQNNLTYGSFSQEELQATKLSSLYCMVPKEEHQCSGVIQLLLYFGWMWIGVFTFDKNKGEHFLQKLNLLLSQNGICLAFTQKIPQQAPFEEISEILDLVSIILNKLIDQKANNFSLTERARHFLHNNRMKMLSILMFLFPKAVTLSCPASPTFPVPHEWFKPGHPVIGGMLTYGSFPKKSCRLLKVIFTLLHGPKRSINAVELYNFFFILDGCAAQIYSKVSFNNSAGNTVYFKKKIQSVGGFDITTVILQTDFLTKLKLETGERVFLNEKGEATGGFDITNMITFPNRSFQRVRVGKIYPSAPKGKELFIDEDMIVWHSAFNQVLPISLCNVHCSPGYWKKGMEGKQFCCYNCVPCPEGKISNQNNMDYCFECSQDHYPNKEQKGYILKLLNFSLTERARHFLHNNRMKMLFLLLSLVPKVVTLSCPASDAFPVPHEWFFPGDLVIGGMVSQFFYHFHELELKEHPSIKHFHLPLTYGSFAQEELQATELSSLYCMVPKEEHQYTGIIQLLLHFGWTWIGAFTYDKNKGEHFLQKLNLFVSQNGISLAFTHKIPEHVPFEELSKFFDLISTLFEKLIDEKAKVFLVYGISFNNSAGERVFLNEKGEVTGGFDITNMITFPNRSFQKVRVGKIDPSAPKGKELFIDEDMIVWHPAFNQVWTPLMGYIVIHYDTMKMLLFVLPISLCNDHCSPGYWKKGMEGEQFCCYNCVPCPEGKFSNQNDMDNCFECSQDYYPHKEQKGCILKLLVFLSFEEILGTVPKAITLSSPASAAFSVPHKWFLPGDVIIGGMLTYGSFSQEELQATKLSSLYCMVPKEKHQYNGVIQLLLYFGWTWIEVFTFDKNEGEHFLQKLNLLLFQNGICLAFTQKIPQQVPFEKLSEFLDLISIILNNLIDQKANVFLVYDMDYCFECSQDHYPNKARKGCILKLLNFSLTERARHFLHNNRMKMLFLLLSLVPKAVTLSCPASPAFPIPHEWFQSADLVIGGMVSQIFYHFHEVELKDHPSIKHFNLPLTYGSFNQEELQATELSSLYFMVSKEEHQYSGIIQLLHHFGWTWIGAFTFDKNKGEHFLQKLNLLLSQNRICLAFTQKLPEHVPIEDLAELFDLISTLFKKLIDQKAKVLPISLCNDHCSPGYWKKGMEGEQFCCYNCVLCPEGKISNQNDMDNCFECSVDHYPNKERKGCILKLLAFLTFEENLGTVSLSCPASDAFPVPHEWFQPGDLVIGGMVSQFFYYFHEFELKDHRSIKHFHFPLTYGSFAQEELQATELSSLYCMVPNEEHQYNGILQLLVHFRQCFECSEDHYPNKEKKGCIMKLLAFLTFEENLGIEMLFLLIFLVPKAVSLSCPASDAFPVPHEWFQPGDLVIGGMLTYGSFAQDEFQATKLSSLYCMVPKEENQYAGIIKLLLHFGWTWIGVFTFNKNKGEHFLQKMHPLFSQNGICLAFTQKIPQQAPFEDLSELFDLISIISNKMVDQKANVFLVYGISFNNSDEKTALFNDIRFYQRVKVGKLHSSPPKGKELTTEENIIFWHPGFN
ncbi:hypothetical protein E2320_003573 [Naja naja]|nr:hypothetical protein E2320_003573 [Naja naja]